MNRPAQLHPSPDPALIAQTLSVWQPYYPQPLTQEDAVEMLLTVGNLYRVLAEVDHEP